MREDASVQWHQQESDEEIAESLTAWVDRIEEDQSWMKAYRSEMLAYYTGRDINGTEWDDLMDEVDVNRFKELYAGYARSAADTSRGHMLLDKPRPYVVTTGGTADLRRAGRKAQQALDAIFKAKVDPILADVVRDGQIFGTVGMRPYVEDGEVKVDVIGDGELLVDERVKHRNKVRTIGVRVRMEVDELLAIYGDDEDIAREIENAAETKTEDGKSAMTETLSVIEAWHLSMTDEPGVRVVAIYDGPLLEKAPYEGKTCPIVFYRWAIRTKGFRGQSLLEIVAPLQEEATRLMKKAQRAMKAASHAWIFKHKNTGIPDGFIRGEDGLIFDVEGNQQMPVVQVFDAVAAQTYRHMIWVIEQIYAVSGVSMMAAQSESPTSHMSGEAVRMHLNINSTRFAEQLQTLQEAIVDLGNLVLDLLEENPDVSADFVDGSVVKQVDWNAIATSRENLKTVLHPSSPIPSTPEGKKQFAMEMVQGGIMQPSIAMGLLAQSPDSEAFKPLEVMEMEVIDAIIERMASDEPEEGESLDSLMEMPSEFVSPQVALLRSKHHVLKFRREEIEEERIQLIEQWASRVKQMVEDAQKKEAAIAAEAAAQQQQAQVGQAIGGAIAGAMTPEGSAQ